MKYIIQHWDSKYDGVLFFVQRLEEMLFHYSEDIFRAPVHNTASLLLEYNNINNEKGLTRNNLEIIAEEIEDSLRKDIVIKQLIGIKKVDCLIDALKNNPEETCHYMSSLFPINEYQKWCALFLIKHLSMRNAKDEIDNALRSWVSSIIYKGYTPEYIYRFLKTTFEKDVDNPLNAACDYINHFNLKTKKYRVYLIFLGASHQYKELLRKRLHFQFEDDGFFDKFNITNQAFVGYKDYDAIDPYSAKDCAVRDINIWIDFYRVLSNRKKSLIGKNSLVRSFDTNEIIKMQVSPIGYKFIEIDPSANIQESIDTIVLGCQEKDQITYSTLRRMVKLHNNAIQQTDLEDGFVNLWSVLEIVSNRQKDLSNDEKGRSTIINVVGSVLPILQNDYYSKYINSINKDLKDALSREDYKALLSSIDGDTPFETLMKILLLPQYDDLLKEYTAKLCDYPNIRHKMYQLYKNRDDRSAFFKISERYAQRLKWHLFRLYRVRNMIVHAGKKNKDIRVLGEHLETYCDSVLIEVMVKLATNRHFNTIEDVLTDTRILLCLKKDRFSSKDIISEEDILVIEKKFFQDGTNVEM